MRLSRSPIPLRPAARPAPHAAALLLWCACQDPATVPMDGGPDGGTPPVLKNHSRFNTVLGRPTATSIAVSVLPGAAGDQVYVEYATQLDATQGALLGAARTAAVTAMTTEPLVLDITGLRADTLYYYRVHLQPRGQADVADNLHSFHTQRAPGQSFHFGVQGDTHPERPTKMFNAELFTLTMQQVRDRQPDLYFMLGDDFSIERTIQRFKDANYGPGYLFTKAVEGALPYGQYQGLKAPFSQPMIVDGVGALAGDAAYAELRKQYLHIMANATALFLVNGNHEQAHSANLGGVFNNAAVWAADGRLKYYPLPAPGGFYSGDDRRLAAVNGYPTIGAADGLLRDYYAFTWGDALFVTIDPYWHADNMPESTLYNGDNSKDLWSATMGDEQYAWLQRTLEGSRARWKFVFTHHINGTGRGGAGSLSGEWGASLKDLKARRPSWPKSVHQLLADTKVTIFFQAHDHLYAREIIDGVVYQAVPNPGDHSYFAYNCDAYHPMSISWQGAAGYGVYDPSSSVRMPNGGFLDVTVTPDAVRVDYVRTYRAVDLQTNPNHIFTGKETNGEVAFRYSVPPQPGDHQAKDFPYTCLGAEPPAGWVYNP